MAETNTLLAAISVASLGLAAFALFRRPKQDNSALQILQSQVAQLSAQLNERMKETTGALHSTQSAMGQRLDHAASVVALLERKLGTLEESNRQIFSLGEGLQELRDVLKSPKLRGSMGEFFLEDLLSQILPPAHFRTQHGFRTGDVVDAAILLGDSLVPIDSKFPLESYLRLAQLPESEADLKKKERRAFEAAIRRHADSIARKYILPEEGTLDFALMYIPAEGVFHECILREEGGEESLHSYLLSRRVIPVSPHSLFAYLQVIVMGLKGLRMESQAKKIWQDLRRLQGDLGRFREEYSVLGRHLRNAAGSYEESLKKIERFEAGLTGLEAGEQESPEGELDGPRA